MSSVDPLSPNSQVPTAEAARRPIGLVEFDALDDEAFLRAAYRRLLGRSPDPAGWAVFLSRLRSGVRRVEILGDIRYSPEGNRVGRAVIGLRWRYAWWVLFRLPGLGTLARRWHRRRRTSRFDSALGPGAATDADYLARPAARADAEFIDAAYRQHLGRRADVSGRYAYLARLRDGQSRTDISDSIRESPEAQARRALPSGISSSKLDAGGAPTVSSHSEIGRQLHESARKWASGGRRMDS